MTVKELIDKLSGCDPDKPIWIDFDHYIEQAGRLIVTEDYVYIE